MFLHGLADRIQQEIYKVELPTEWDELMDLALRVDAEAAFTKLRSRFVSASILRAPDPTHQFVVEVDASEVGVGAVLSQRATSDDKMHPCAFFFPSIVSCRTQLRHR